MNPLDTTRRLQPLQERLLQEPDAIRRDHLWALGAPALMRDAAPSLATLLGDPLRTDAEPSPSTRRRLGLYFEDLVADLLGASADAFHRNIPCRQDGRTLGEFDFVYRSRARWCHLETAVKFYLCVGDGRELRHFVGPALRDRLDIKWQHLQAHQLRLSCMPAGNATLERLGVEAVTTQLLMPGYLFYRPGADIPAPQLHPGINPGHLRGFWCTLSEFRDQPSVPNERYAVLHKLRWLSPARLEREDTLHLMTLLERLERQAQPVLVSILGALDDGDWGERRRGFVVPDDWPQRARDTTKEGI